MRSRQKKKMKTPPSLATDEEVTQFCDREDDRSSHTSMGSADSEEVGRSIQAMYEEKHLTSILRDLAEEPDIPEIDEMDEEFGHGVPLPEVHSAITEQLGPLSPRSLSRVQAVMDWRKRVKEWLHAAQNMPSKLWQMAEQRGRDKCLVGCLLCVITVFGAGIAALLLALATPPPVWPYVSLDLYDMSGCFINNTYTWSATGNTRYELHTRIDGTVIMFATNEFGVEWLGRQQPATSSGGIDQEWYMSAGDYSTLYRMTPPKALVNWSNPELRMLPKGTGSPLSSEPELVSTTATLWSSVVFDELLSRYNVTTPRLPPNSSVCIEPASVCVPQSLAWRFIPSTLAPVCTSFLSLFHTQCAQVMVMEVIDALVTCQLCEWGGGLSLLGQPFDKAN